MTLKEFCSKYSLDTDEIFEIISFEGFPIESVDSEIDDKIAEHLMGYVEGWIRSKKKGQLVYKNKKKVDDYSKAESIEPFLVLKENKIVDCVKTSNLSAETMITFFLKNGKLYNLNRTISTEEILELAKEFSIKTRLPICKVALNSRFLQTTSCKKRLIKRPPVITIVGHIDHGKTTLLNAIIKKNITTSEKGGITQKLGCYVITYNDSDIIFVDTPGHEVFSLIRERGVGIADLAILVIAADDGIKPQTVEAIKIINQSKLPVVIAITKVDNLTSKIEKDAQINKIYSTLSEHSLVVEPWGGEVPAVEVASIKEVGISNLLETIQVFSDLLELKTDTCSPASGYILDIKNKKGIGAVASIMLKSGKIEIGDYFLSEGVRGKCNLIKDISGKSASSAKAPYPILLGTFDGNPKIGDSFCVVEKEIAKRKNKRPSSNFAISYKENGVSAQHVSGKAFINVILKAEGVASLEALSKAINNLNLKAFRTARALSSSIGNVTKSDILYAKDSGAIIYAFNVKEDDGAKEILMSSGKEYDIRTFDVIYKLIENLDLELNKRSKIKIKEELGSAVVLKVFNIKKIGKIAGFKINSGAIKKGGSVFIIRNGKEIGTGKIESLQKDRSSEKLLEKGEEGAISVSGFCNWIEGDEIISFVVIEKYEGE
jgi:translation initiation factor IF-2